MIIKSAVLAVIVFLGSLSVAADQSKADEAVGTTAQARHGRRGLDLVTQ
jgi:hypothetical protein